VRDGIVLVRLTPLLLASLAVISVRAVMTLLLDKVSSHYVTCNINLYHRLFWVLSNMKFINIQIDELLTMMQ
jgi:hypothetical protein